MQGHFPTLDMMPYILDHFAPENMDIDALDSLIIRIQEIHRIRRDAYLSS